MILKKKSPLLLIISLVILIHLSYIISISFMNVQMSDLPKNPWEREVIYPSVKASDGSVKQEEILPGETLGIKRGLMGKKSMKILIITLPIILVLFVAITVFMLMGWDKGILKSSVSGHVYDQKSLPLKNVSIKIGELSSVTDENGYYKIENLDYGSNKAVITAPDYETLNSDVTLSRGDNLDRNFTLKQVTYSYIEGILLSNSDRIDVSSLKLMAGDKEVVVKEDKTFKTEQLTGEKITLTLTSSIYRDQTIEVKLVPGKNILNEFSLAPAKDFKISVSDWLTGDKLDSVKIIGGNISLTTDKDGLATVTDLDDGAKLDVKLSKNGYLEKTFAVKNIGVDIPLEIVQSGKIAYISNRDGKTNIYNSNYDGSDEKKLTDGKGTITDYSIKENLVYFISDRDSIKGTQGNIIPQIYSIPINGGDIKKVSNLKGREFVSGNIYRYDVVFLGKGLIVSTVLPENNLSYDIGGSAELEKVVSLEVRKLDGTLLSTIKDFGHGKFYSTETNLFKPYTEIGIIGVDQTSNSVITQLSYCPDNINNPYACNYYIQKLGPNKVQETKTPNFPYIAHLSNNGEYVYYYSYDEQTNKSVNYIYNFSSGNNKVAIENSLNITFTSISGDTLLGIGNYDQKRNVYAFDLKSNSISPVTSTDKIDSFNVINPTTIIFLNDGKVYIQRIGKTAKATGISLTPIGWVYNGYDYQP